MSKRRGRRPSATASTRLILGDIRVRLGMDPEMDKLYQRIMALPRGTRGRTVCAWLITGAAVESKVDQGELDEIRQRTDNLLDNFLV